MVVVVETYGALPQCAALLSPPAWPLVVKRSVPRRCLDRPLRGAIVGAVTGAPWGVEFPYAEGHRHPVVLYDGAKNLIDLFREYPTHRFALGAGQTLNVVMAVLGGAALYRSRLRRLDRLGRSASPSQACRRSA